MTLSAAPKLKYNNAIADALADLGKPEESAECSQIFKSTCIAKMSLERTAAVERWSPMPPSGLVAEAVRLSPNDETLTRSATPIQPVEDNGHHLPSHDPRP